MGLVSTGDNNFGQPGKWYVHPTPGLGTHTTITAALASASSKDTIYLAAGFTFTENLTISIPVQIAALGVSTANSVTNTIILGLVTINLGGNQSSFTNIEFAANSGNNITSSAANTSITFTNCDFFSGGPGGNINQSGSGTWWFSYCNFEGAATTSLFTLSGTAIFNFQYCWARGFSQGSSTISSGSVLFRFCELSCLITTSSTAAITIEDCVVDNIGNNVFLTHGGTGTSFITNSYIASGTAAAISIGTGATLTASNLIINSTNANPITGLGTLNYSEIEQVGTPGTFNTSTINPLETDIGTLKLITPLAASSGGTGASNVSSATGTILISNGTNFVPSTATYPSTAGTSGTILISNGTNFVNTTATYPATTTINRLLYSSATNVIGQVTTANDGVVITGNTGIPGVLVGPGTARNILVSVAGNNPVWSPFTLPVQTFASTVVTVVGAPTIFGTSAANAGTTSTAAYVMLGLGSTWGFTPIQYTSARVTINGQLVNTTTGDGINVIIAFGTGTPPANGAAATGTTVGVNTIFTDLTGLTTNGAPFSKHAIITGLTPGTFYWFDLQFKAVTGGTASVLNVEFSAQELQY
jgi:hypothetical protein